MSARPGSSTTCPTASTATASTPAATRSTPAATGPQASATCRTGPTDGSSHPERTIRNGIFGRNAAEPYEVDPDAHYNALQADDVQKVRDEYLVNQYTPRNAAPLSANQIIGARTPAELHQQRANQPWAP